MTNDGEALFDRRGDGYVPGELARGPWSADALHGGPVAALVTRAAEACEPEPAMHLARLTVELLRPVPFVPLRVEATMLRPGHKLQVVEVTVSGGDGVLARGRAVRIRTREDGAEGLQPDEMDRGQADGAVPPPGPERGAHSTVPLQGHRGFHNAGAELRFVAGRFDGRGPASVWVRLAVPVVAGEGPSPAQRAAAAADFGNGVSSVLDFDRFAFVNPDLSVYLFRPPAGEWVCLRAVTHLGTPGTGMAESELWDETGRIGRAVQSLVVEPRR